MSRETQYASMAELMQVFLALAAHRAFRGSHISLDRNSQGHVYVAVAADWIDASGLRFVLELAARHEVAVTLDNRGLRIESHSSEMVAAVEAVKDVLDAENEDAEEGDDD